MQDRLRVSPTVLQLLNARLKSEISGGQKSKKREQTSTKHKNVHSEPAGFLSFLREIAHDKKQNNIKQENNKSRKFTLLFNIFFGSITTNTLCSYGRSNRLSCARIGLITAEFS